MRSEFTRSLSILAEIAIHAGILTFLFNIFGVKPMEYLMWVTFTKVVLMQTDIEDIKKDFR
jgi:hypothetical protein